MKTIRLWKYIIFFGTVIQVYAVCMEADEDVYSAPTSPLKDHFYRIDDSLSLGQSLTAKKEGKLVPSPVIMAQWKGLETQIWEMNEADHGMIMIPLKHDFNEVTYLVKNGASANQVWKFEVIIDREHEQIAASNGVFMLKNSHLQCLRSAGLGRAVQMVTCNATDVLQHWIFEEVNIEL